MQQMIVQLPYLQQRILQKKFERQYGKVKHLLVNTHLETRKELIFSIIKIRDT
jgi:hypothetical protein